MSDGYGKDNVSENKSKKLRADEFAEGVARIAVAQLCESLGFQGIQQSALDTLSDIGLRYMRDVGRTATSYANLANRNECNVFDVIQGLEDLGSVQGFSGACDVSHCLAESGVVMDIVRYVDEAEIMPFLYSVPSFPIVKERKVNPSFAQSGGESPPEHVPDWLPKFPDSEVCTVSDKGKGKESEKDVGFSDKGKEKESEKDVGVEDKVPMVEEKHEKVEKSSLNLQQKLCNGSELGVGFEKGEGSKTRRAVELNPFLAPPLQPGTEEVSVPVLPDKLLHDSMDRHENHVVVMNHASAMGPSMASVEAVQNGPCDSKEDGKKILLNDRPGVQFKFGSRRKFLGKVPGSDKLVSERMAVWFGDDHNGKDQKKRSVEHVLEENMETQQEDSSFVSSKHILEENMETQQENSSFVN